MGQVQNPTQAMFDLLMEINARQKASIELLARLVCGEDDAKFDRFMLRLEESYVHFYATACNDLDQNK